MFMLVIPSGLIRNYKSALLFSLAFGENKPHVTNPQSGAAE